MPSHIHPQSTHAAFTENALHLVYTSAAAVAADHNANITNSALGGSSHQTFPQVNNGLPNTASLSSMNQGWPSMQSSMFDPVHAAHTFGARPPNPLQSPTSGLLY